MLLVAFFKGKKKKITKAIKIKTRHVYWLQKVTKHLAQSQIKKILRMYDFLKSLQRR